MPIDERKGRPEVPLRRLGTIGIVSMSAQEDHGHARAYNPDNQEPHRTYEPEQTQRRHTPEHHSHIDRGLVIQRLWVLVDFNPIDAGGA